MTSTADYRLAASRRRTPTAHEVSSAGRTVVFDPLRHRAAWARYERANAAAHADYTARCGLRPLVGYAAEQRQYVMRAARRRAARR